MGIGDGLTTPGWTGREMACSQELSDYKIRVLFCVILAGPVILWDTPLLAIGAGMRRRRLPPTNSAGFNGSVPSREAPAAILMRLCTPRSEQPPAYR